MSKTTFCAKYNDNYYGDFGDDNNDQKYKYIFIILDEKRAKMPKSKCSFSVDGFPIKYWFRFLKKFRENTWGMD